MGSGAVCEEIMRGWGEEIDCVHLCGVDTREEGCVCVWKGGVWRGMRTRCACVVVVL